MVVSIISGVEFMTLGLDIAGFRHWMRCIGATTRFNGWYGTEPTTCEAIWVDLQTTTDDDGRIENNANPVGLLLALRFLKAHPTEKELSGAFKMTDKTVRKWNTFYARKIQLLKTRKISNTYSLYLFSNLWYFDNQNGNQVRNCVIVDEIADS
jgi:hypothetical protein